ncbi:MAG: hypothetical protein ABSH10_07225 [Phycisphaerae bacterium]|jgi:hypothetical protein
MRPAAAARLWVLGLASVLAAAGGCEPTAPRTALTRQELIAQHNANAREIPRLWARARIALTLTDSQGRTVSWGSTSAMAGPNGLLLYARGPKALGPHDFVLIGRAAGATELFRLGNSAKEGAYYLWYGLGERRGAMWGRDELAGAPGVDMPIDPMQILSVLNITALPDNFTTLPAVVMTLSDQPRAYVLTTIDRQPVSGEILCRKEIYCTWDDRQPPRPYRVNLFDAAGRCVMTAELKDYKPIHAAASAGPAPQMPTDVEITWPEKRSRIHLVLSDMTTDDTWDREQTLFRSHLPAGLPPDQVTQVDKNLRGGGEE